MVDAAGNANGVQKRKRSRVVKPKPSLEPGVSGAAEGEHAGNSKLARALGSVDWHTREKGVAALTRFLQGKAALEEKDMMKLWKGLFYAFWHSDKQPVQAELADRLSNVVLELQPEMAFLFFTCFVKTMRREWFGIDRLRLDKFLMLIRKFVAAQFTLLANNKWQPSLVSRYADFLGTTVMPTPAATAATSTRALGIAYHIADLFLPELKAGCAGAAARAGAGSKGGDASAAACARAAVPGDALTTLLQPFVDVLLTSGDVPVLDRISEGVFDVLVTEVRKPSDGQPLRNLDAAAYAAALFAAGAQPDVRMKNRERLYGVSEQLEKALAKRLRFEAKTNAAGGGAGTGGGSGGRTAAASAAPAAAAAAAPAAAAPAGPEPEASGKGSGAKLKKRKASLVGGAEDGGSGSAAANGGPAAVAPASAKAASTSGGADGAGASVGVSAKKKARLAAAAAGAAGASAASGTSPSSAAPAPEHSKPAPAAGLPKSSSKKERKAAAAAAGAANGGAAHAAANGGGAAARAAPAAATPGGKRAAAPPSALKSAAPLASAKKRVQINLKKNLYFEFGGPVPSAEVRTPLTARSKGGILKGGAGSRQAPGSAPAKVGASRLSVDVRAGSASADKGARPGGGGHSGKVSPRPGAALFF